jgi:hypothetical protein
MADHAVPDGYVDDGVAPADRAVADALDEAPDGRADDDGMAQANAAAPDDGVALDDASGGRADDDGMALAADGRVDVEGGEVEDEPAPVDDPWIRSDGAPGAGDLVEDDVVAAEVAGQLGTVVGEEADADPAEFAAAAVLDVLRASGWADVAEATELRAEAARLRELLAEVIRDHRAREASMAGFENQQLHWLVPLLRAAHGVAFGSLGAKVALRTAVQEVPPEVLASAGLRIDYGVPPDQEDDR